MICDTFPEQVEYHDKMQAILYPETPYVENTNQYLARKLNEFCRKTGVKPSEIFKRTHKYKYVMLRVAFYYFLDGFNLVKTGEFLGYNHTTIIHWRDKLHPQFMQKYEYRKLIEKIE